MFLRMKKTVAALAASLIFCLGSHAQDWSRIQSLYNAGMYSEVSALLEKESSPTALGWRALCALSMRTDDSYALADDFLGLYPENIMAPQVGFAYGLDLFDNGRYEDALARFNRISVEDLYEDQKAEFTYKLGQRAFWYAQGVLAGTTIPPRHTTSWVTSTTLRETSRMLRNGSSLQERTTALRPLQTIMYLNAGSTSRITNMWLTLERTSLTRFQRTASLIWPA